MNQEDYYKILQVDPAAEPEVIAAAYRRLAQKYHPDAQAVPFADRRMQELNQAYDVLSHPDKRAHYDRARSARPALSLVPALPDQIVDQQAARAAHLPPAEQAPRRWKSGRSIAALIGIAALLAIGTTAFLLRPAPEATPQSSSIVWEGECGTATGYLYACRVRLKISPTNRVSGSINWRLKITPRPEEQLAIGQQARASVRGTFDPDSRRITIGSHTQDDPYDLIDANEYRLSLSADWQTLSGETYDDGLPQGTLSATRKD
ncbi:MAG TPA: DnaJ domain-containing protein [Herpetosiphonaceae bacterium]